MMYRHMKNRRWAAGLMLGLGLAAGAATAQTSLKLAYALSTSSHYGAGAKAFASALEKDGNYTIEAFPNSALGGERYREDIGNATEEEIAQAAHDTIPHVAPLFWSFRLMVGLGFYFIAFFALAFWLASRQQLDRYRGFLKLAFWSLPLPWVSI